MEKTPERQIAEPVQDNAIHGAKIAFTELLKTNITVLQQQLKTPRFKVEYFKVGTVTESEVAVCYVEGIVDLTILDSVIERISNLKVAYVPNKKIVTDALQSKWAGDVFPTLRENERIDTFVSGLMQGRVGIVVDNNPFGVVVPSLFWECFSGPDDYFMGTGRFVGRILRLCSFLMAILLPAILVALIHHPMPVLKHAPKFLEHKSVIPQVTQIVIVSLIYRNLLDIVFRIHRNFVFFLSIVAANVIGQISISAKLFDPVIIFIVSLAMISGLEVINRLLSLTQLRLILIPVAYWFGFTGLLVACTIVIIYAAFLKSFGVPYLSPLLPLRLPELRDSIFVRGNLKAIVNRPHYYNKETE